jgi:hypothetical protein
LQIKVFAASPRVSLDMDDPLTSYTQNKSAASLEKDHAKELARKLPDEAFHLQIKKPSENAGRVQAGVFHDVVNRGEDTNGSAFHGDGALMRKMPRASR